MAERDLPVLEGPGGALALAGPARARALSLSGRRASAHGTERAGIERVQIGAWTVDPETSAGSGVAASVVVGPSSVRREFVTAAGSVLETVLVTQGLAAAVFQWRRPEGGASALTLVRRWSVGWVGAEPLRAATEPGGGRIRITAGAHDEGPTAFLALDPPTAEWTVEPDGAGLRIEATVTADVGEAVTLLVAAGASARDAESVLRAVSNLRVEEIRAERALDDAKTEGLSLSTGVAALDEGLEWAKARVRGAVRVGPNGVLGLQAGGGACVDSAADSAEPVWVALGALAAGDPEPCEILLAGDLATPYHLILAGRYAAWSGQMAPLMAARARLDVAASALEAGPRTPTTAVAAHELAFAWESMGERPRADAIRSRFAGGGGGGRRLPMLGRVGGGGDAGEEALVSALFAETPGPYREPVGEPSSGLERGLRAWAACRSGDPDVGYLRLREHLDEGLEAGGLWAAGSCSDHAASAALVSAAVLFGLLGGRADAPVGRLSLAPRLPSAWRTFAVSGIPVADSRVWLRYERNGGEHQIRVGQDAGRVPLMLVLEPELPTSAALELQVDGEPADLECVPLAGGRTRIRVQLPLDRERKLSVRESG